MNKSYDEAINKILSANSIAIFSHINYDCDALGSLYGLGEYLKSLKKKVYLYIDSEISYPHTIIFNPKYISNNIEPFDLGIVVDVAPSSRLGKYENVILNHNNTIRLDHHLGNYHYTSIEIVENFASASEIILELICKMGNVPNKSVATYLYAGIISDTNNFTTDNATSKTLENGFKLLKYGAEKNIVVNVLYKTVFLKQEKMRGKVFSRVKVFDGDIAITYFTLKDLKKYQLKEADIKFSNEFINLDGINIACLIKERQHNQFSCSLRSKTGYDVNRIATANGGGGHEQASSCPLNGSLRKIKKKILQSIRQYR